MRKLLIMQATKSLLLERIIRDSLALNGWVEGKTYYVVDDDRNVLLATESAGDLGGQHERRDLGVYNYQLREIFAFFEKPVTISRPNLKILVEDRAHVGAGMLLSALSGLGQAPSGYDFYRYVQDGLHQVCERSYTGAEFAGYIRLDISKDEDLMRLLEAFKFDYIGMSEPATATDIKQCVSPGLLTIINASPKDELVLGFLIRELGVRLPTEVQEQGSEAICKWVVDQVNLQNKARYDAWVELRKTKPLAAAPEPVKPTKNTTTVKFERTHHVLVRVINDRYDTESVEIEVPNEVISEALDDGDEEVIQEWIIDQGDDAGRRIVYTEGELEAADTAEPDHQDTWIKAIINSEQLIGQQ